MVKFNPPMDAENASKIEVMFPNRDRLELPLVLDSKPYSPYKWTVFLVYFVISASSGWLLISYYLVGNISPSSVLSGFRFAAFVGVVLGTPLAILFLLNLISPPRLLADKAGVSLLKYGGKRRLLWTDIKSIHVDQKTGRYGTPIFYTCIHGKTRSLKWNSNFGVDPRKLVQFLNDQRSANAG